MISDKNIFTKHEKQNIHWAVCNSEITHYECICDENSSKQKCKDNDDRLTDKELCTESVAAKKNQNTETELFCEVVRDVFSN